MRNRVLKIGMWTLCLLLGLSLNLVSQDIITRKDLNKKSLKTYKKAIAEGRQKKYQKSLDLFEKVIEKNPLFIDAQLRRAGMLHNMKRFEESASGFLAALELAPDYDPQVYYSLAVVHRDMEQFGVSAKYFQDYLDHSKDKKRKKRAKFLRDRMAFMDDAFKHPVPFEPIKVEGGVSTEYSEYIPLMTIEGDRMIFTRRINNQEDFYIAEFKNGEFTRTVEVEGLNTPNNEGVHTISSDGRMIIFTVCNERNERIGACDLYFTRLDSDFWTIPNNMGRVVNSTRRDRQPSLSADGKKLFFSSERQFGHGGYDIWMTTRTDTTGWTLPVVLGKNINTPGNEESPFIHPDGKTLYFRSDTHTGMGGYDIFYSRYIDSTKTWGPANNIGYPINTEGDEGALSVSLDGKLAFYSSDRAYLKDRKNANLDIYMFELYEEARPLLTTFVKANVIDKTTKLPIVAGYIIEALNGKEENISGFTNEEGNFITSLPTDKNYGFFVEAEGYLLHSKNIELTGVRESLDPYILTIELTPVPNENPTTIESLEPIVLENIFFETGSALLREESTPEIERLAKNLKQNPSLKIQINGHTDDIGTEIDNQKLSEERAKSVMDALISKGILPARISYVGYGESKPLTSNETEEGRSTNRRTEFVLK